jgi:hypothetical protein
MFKFYEGTLTSKIQFQDLCFLHFRSVCKVLTMPTKKGGSVAESALAHNENGL